MGLSFSFVRARATRLGFPSNPLSSTNFRYSKNKNFRIFSFSEVASNPTDTSSICNSSVDLDESAAKRPHRPYPPKDHLPTWIRPVGQRRSSSFAKCVAKSDISWKSYPMPRNSQNSCPTPSCFAISAYKKSPRCTPCMQKNGSVDEPATDGVNSIAHRFGTCLKTCVGRGQTTELPSRQNDNRETVQRWKV